MGWNIKHQLSMNPAIGEEERVSVCAQDSGIPSPKDVSLSAWSLG